MTRVRLQGHDVTQATRAQATLQLADGRPIDFAVQPPRGCRGDLVTTRPCARTACRFHLWPQDERPGRPHSPGARPPVKLRTLGPSCMWDQVRANEEGMTADDVGEAFGVVGERMLQVENRALLKLKAIDHVCAVLEAARTTMPVGTELELVMAHNDHQLPNQHFVTVAIRVREQTAKAAQAGVSVRKRRA